MSTPTTLLSAPDTQTAIQPRSQAGRLAPFCSVALASALLTLGGCVPTNHAQPEQTGRPKYGYQGTEQVGSPGYQTQYRDAAPTTPPPAPTTADAPPSVNPAPEPAPTPAPVVEKKDYQYGTPVPGRPGFVTSPHAPYSGYVDVRGFPPGTEVKDPYTGKIFLVP